MKYLGTRSIKALLEDTLNNILYTHTPFKEVDSNLEAWLRSTVEASNHMDIYGYELETPIDNKQLIEKVGDVSSNLFTMGQIREVIDSQCRLLHRNGFSNLFLVMGDTKVYIVGVVFDKYANGFVPYIYKTKNLYRAWNRGNHLFVRCKN